MQRAMNASASTVFSTGVSVHWPRDDRQHRAAEAPFYDPPLHPDASTDAHNGRHRTQSAAAAQARDDDECYSAYQELAYQYAVEQTTSAVRTVLLKANAECYRHVLRYFERYRSADTCDTIPSNAFDARVAFPEFHGFPTAAILAGTDATNSDMWVHPLCQVLQQSFPLVFVVQEGFQNARRMLEWLVEQLDAVQRLRDVEERWLFAQIDRFDLFDAPFHTSTTLHGGSNRPRLRHRPPSSPHAVGHKSSSSTNDTIDTDFAFQNDDSDASENDSSGDSSDDDSDASDTSDTRKWRRKRLNKKSNQRRGRRRALKAKAAAVAAADRVYAKWTIAQLLERIHLALDASFRPDEPCLVLVHALRALLIEKLDAALMDVQDDLQQSIRRYDDTIAWLKRQIAAIRALTPSTASVRVRSTEFALAQLLQHVLYQCQTFLHDNTRTNVQDAALVTRSRRRIVTSIQRHDAFYHFDPPPPLLSSLSSLSSSSTQPDADAATRPFVLICIEQLEALNQQVLDDFLRTWTHFNRLDDSFTSKMQVGFVVGVASAASPALRHLNLSIVSNIDVQFFPLDDSRKCFDDIVEALVVDTNLPLTINGAVFQSIVLRYRMTQSIATFLHALSFLLFLHFKSVPWSFIGHFGLDAHANRPLASSVTAPTRRVGNWLSRQQAVRHAVTLQDHLLVFSDSKLEELHTFVFGTHEPTNDDWLVELLDDVAAARQAQARWRVGWHCFRAACAWLELPFTNSDAFVGCLRAALDGTLMETATLNAVMRALATCSLFVLTHVVDDWRSQCDAASAQGATANLVETAALLTELVDVCRYADATQHVQTTQRMLAMVRTEVQQLFLAQLISALVTRRPQPTRVSQMRVFEWTTATETQALEARLRINYYDELKELLLAIEDDDTSCASGEDEIDAIVGVGHAAGTSWVNDVSLAFLHYQETAGLFLSFSDWYETFADALQDEFAALDRNHERMGRAIVTDDDAFVIETKARFLRAFCTLRHWGFVKSLRHNNKSSDRDTIEKLVFI